MFSAGSFLRVRTIRTHWVRIEATRMSAAIGARSCCRCWMAALSGSTDGVCSHQVIADPMTVTAACAAAWAICSNTELAAFPARQVKSRSPQSAMDRPECGVAVDRAGQVGRRRRELHPPVPMDPDHGAFECGVAALGGGLG